MRPFLKVMAKRLYTTDQAVVFCTETDNEDDIDSSCGGLSSSEEEELDDLLENISDYEELER